MDKLIEKRFKDLGISPEEYIRKIIQIDIRIPTWQNDAVMKLLENIIESLHKKHAIHLKDNKKLLELLIELNPRQVKRFINGLLMLISGNKYDPQQTKQYLVLQVLQKKWPELYQNLLDPKRRDISIKYLEGSPELDCRNWEDKTKSSAKISSFTRGACISS